MVYYQFPGLLAGIRGFVNGEVNEIILDSGWIYACGGFTSYISPSGNTLYTAGFVKISQSTGEADPNFNQGTGFNGQVYSIAFDGTSIYAGGTFSSYNGTSRSTIAKINATTGALDTTFNTASGSNGTIRCVRLDSSNNLYIGGSFTTYKGTNARRVAKINNSTGAIDATFDTTTGTNDDVLTLLPDNSGNLYIAGRFSSYKSTTRLYLAKINATTAALDTTFTTASGPNGWVTAIARDSGTGSIYIGGQFTSYKGTGRQRVAMIDPSTAALDTTFNTANGANGDVNSLRLDGLGYLFIGGSFSIYKSTARQRVAKIDYLTGALEATFDTASGVSGGNQLVNFVQIDGPGDLYIIGDYTNYKSVTVNGIVKVNSLTAARTGW